MSVVRDLTPVKGDLVLKIANMARIKWPDAPSFADASAVQVLIPVKI